MTYRIDLHTHSIISSDGGIREDEYAYLFQEKILDCIAITDHNEIRFAQKLHEKFGDKIIVGEEITTIDGEMIGLFLKKTIPAGMTALETAKEIHKQGGVVSIPHPFETLRQGIQRSVLEKMIEEIDILEVFNGRGKWRGKAEEAEAFAKKYHLVGAASSDAHGYRGIGKTFSIIDELPTRTTLRKLLRDGKRENVYAPLITFLYPTFNKVKKLVFRDSGQARMTSYEFSMKELFLSLVFAPAGLANLSAFFSSKIPALKKFNFPVDGGLRFRKKRILGSHKTIRGFIVGTFTAIVGVYIQILLYQYIPFLRELTPIDYTKINPILFGFLAGFGALTGDAVKSFFKRQMSIAPGRSWVPFDQIDYILGGMFFTYLYFPLDWTQYLLLLFVWSMLHPLISFGGYLLKLKKQPI